MNSELDPTATPGDPNPIILQDLSIPWLIIYATDPDPIRRASARAELATRLSQIVYAPIRATLLKHQHPQVRIIIADILSDSNTARPAPTEPTPPPDSDLV